jgi:cytochrome c-type biogenesis protein CcmH/NrfG
MGARKKEVGVIHFDSIRSIILSGALLTGFLVPPIFAANDPNAASAIAALEQNVKTNPANPELWVHLGLAYRNNGDIDKAQNAFQRALSMDPRNSNAMFMLGLLYEKKGQKQEALTLWKQFLNVETNPGRRDVAARHIHQLSQ